MSLRTRIAASLILVALAQAAPAHDLEPTLALAAPTADAPAGAIIDRQACHVPFVDYEDWLGFLRQRRSGQGDAFDEAGFRNAYPQEIFSRLQNGGISCQAITYRSDGLKVEAFVLRPVDSAGKRLPAIIYNRGGNRDFGRLVFANLMEFAAWTDQGFVVLASQYRGSSGSEGQDEFGGADVHDVLNLFPVARQEGADMSNVFMAGFSRGGMMTYLSLKDGAPVRAAAVVGGAADLTDLGSERQDMVDLYRELMPGFDRHAVQLLRERSAVHFAQRLDAPLL